MLVCTLFRASRLLSKISHTNTHTNLPKKMKVDPLYFKTNLSHSTGLIGNSQARKGSSFKVTSLLSRVVCGNAAPSFSVLFLEILLYIAGFFEAGTQTKQLNIQEHIYLCIFTLKVYSHISVHSIFFYLFESETMTCSNLYFCLA